MSRRLKLTLIALLSLGVLVWLLEALIPRLVFSPARLESLRKRAEVGLSTATYGEVHIAKIKPKLSLIRGIHIQVPQVILKHPKRLPIPIQSIALSDIRARFALMALLSGKPRVKTLEIQDCRIGMTPKKEASLPPNPRILLANATMPTGPSGSPRLPLGRIGDYLQNLQVKKLAIEGLSYGELSVVGLNVGFHEGYVQAIAEKLLGFGVQKGSLEASVSFASLNPSLNELSCSIRIRDVTGSLEPFFLKTSPLKRTSFKDTELKIEGPLPSLSLTSKGSINSPLYPETVEFRAQGGILSDFKTSLRIKNANFTLSAPNQESLLKLDLVLETDNAYRFKTTGKGIPISFKTLKQGSVSFDVSGLLSERLRPNPNTLEGVFYLKNSIFSPNPDTVIQADSLTLKASHGNLSLPNQTVLWNQTPFEIEANVENFKRTEIRVLAESLPFKKGMIAEGLDVLATSQDIWAPKKTASFQATVRSLRVQKLAMEAIEGKGTGTFDPKGLNTLTFDHLKAELMGGSAQGPLRVAFSNDGFSMSSPGVTLRGIATSRPMLTFAKKKPKVYLDTKASGLVSLKRSFGPASPFQNGLNGSGDLVLGPGRIHEFYLYTPIKKHLDPIFPLRSFAQALKPFVLKETQEKGYSFDSGRVKFSYDNGLWRIQNANLESPRGISMEASGRVGAGLLEGQGKAIVSENLSASMIQGVPQATWLAKKAKITIPLTLKGSIGHIQVLPDVQELGKSLLPNLLDDLFKGLKDFPSFLK